MISIAALTASLVAVWASPAVAATQTRVLGNSFEDYYESSRLSLAGDASASTLDVELAAPTTIVRSKGRLTRGRQTYGRPGCRLADRQRRALCPTVPPPDAGQPTRLRSLGIMASLGSGDDMFRLRVRRSIHGLWGLRVSAGAGDDRVSFVGHVPRCRRSPTRPKALPNCFVALIGGPGDDHLTLDQRVDSPGRTLVELVGGSGNDTLRIAHAAATSDLRTLRVSCGPGSDKLYVPRDFDLERAGRALSGFYGEGESAPATAPETCEEIIRY